MTEAKRYYKISRDQLEKLMKTAYIAGAVSPRPLSETQDLIAKNQASHLAQRAILKLEWAEELEKPTRDSYRCPNPECGAQWLGDDQCPACSAQGTIEELEKP